MIKFNKFENWMLTSALKNYIDKAEIDVLDAEAKAKKGGKRLIYAPGYFTMVGNDLKDKLDSMTLKRG